MAEDFFAYDRPLADSSAREIHAVMLEIQNELDALRDQVRALGASWIGSEYDKYQDIAGKWDKAAVQIKNVLDQVKSALDAVSGGSDDLRTSIGQVLDDTH